MEIIEYTNEYLSELEPMLVGIQDFEKELNEERESGTKVVKRWINEYHPENNLEKVYLGKDNGQIVGFIWITYSNDLMNKPTYIYLHISDLFIKKEYRGMGYGKEFLKFCEKLGREKKVKGLSLTVLKKNVNAYEVYKKYGFEDLDITMYKRL